MAYQKIFKKPYNLEVIHDYIEHLSFTDKIRYRLLQKNCNDLEEYVDLVNLTSLAKDSGMTLDEYLLSWNDKYYAQKQSEKQAEAVKEEQEALRLAAIFSQYQAQHQPQIKIVEKPVKVIKEIPVADPKQQAKIAELEKQLNTMQNQQSSVIIEPEEKEPEIELIELTKEQKKEFKKLVKSGEKSFAEIAAEYGYDENILRLSVM